MCLYEIDGKWQGNPLWFELTVVIRNYTIKPFGSEFKEAMVALGCTLLKFFGICSEGE